MNALSTTDHRSAALTEPPFNVAPDPPIHTETVPASYTIARVGVLVAILVAEVFSITIRHWWVDLLGKEGGSYALQVLFTALVTVAVFAGDRIRRELAAVWEEVAAAGFSWRALTAQVVAYAAFLALTRALADDRIEDSSGIPWWTLAWLAAGTAAGLLWCIALAPVGVWVHLVRRAWKDLSLAVCVGLLAWMAARYTEGLWHHLAGLTLSAVEVCLRLLFSDIVLDAGARTIGTESFAVEIAPSCSGYEGIGLVSAVLGCYLWLSRASLRFPAAFLLLPLGLAASLALNVVRITALIAIGSWGWPVVAVNGFHTQAGWLSFIFVTLGVMALSRTAGVFRRLPETESESSPARRHEYPLAPHLLPLMAMVAAAMITGVFSDGGFDRYYGVRVLLVGLIAWRYRNLYGRLGWSWSWAAIGGGLFVCALWIGFAGLFPSGGSETGADAFIRLPAWEQWLWLALRIAGAVAVVPLAEELAFRGYLLRALQGLDVSADATGRWNWLAALGSSLVFGLLHPGHWLAGTLAGIVYAWLFIRRGRLGDAILAHAATNAALGAVVLATGRWDLW